MCRGFNLNFNVSRNVRSQELRQETQKWVRSQNQFRKISQCTQSLKWNIYETCRASTFSDWESLTEIKELLNEKCQIELQLHVLLALVCHSSHSFSKPLTHGYCQRGKTPWISELQRTAARQKNEEISLKLSFAVQRACGVRFWIYYSKFAQRSDHLSRRRLAVWIFHVNGAVDFSDSSVIGKTHAFPCCATSQPHMWTNNGPNNQSNRKTPQGTQ